MDDRVRKRLFDARRAVCKVLAFTRGMVLTDYLSDEVTRLADERLLEITGESQGAALRIDSDLATRFPDLRRAVALRNRIIHGYDDINDVVIWDIVQTNLPPLVDHLESLLSDTAAEDGE